MLGPMKGAGVDDQLMSAVEAGQYLGITRQRVALLGAQGRIPRRRIGSFWVYAKSDLDTFKTQPKGRPGRPAKKDARPISSRDART